MCNVCTAQLVSGACQSPFLELSGECQCDYRSVFIEFITVMYNTDIMGRQVEEEAAGGGGEEMEQLFSYLS